MSNVYIEPVPKGRPEGSVIFHFVLEHPDGSRVTTMTHSMQKGAIREARSLGHDPFVALVRNTDKAKSEDWCSASD